MRRLILMLFLYLTSTSAFAEEDLGYVLMGEDLSAIKHDFNAAVDQVRLLLIVGPT